MTYKLHFSVLLFTSLMATCFLIAGFTELFITKGFFTGVFFWIISSGMIVGLFICNLSLTLFQWANADLRHALVTGGVNLGILCFSVVLLAYIVHFPY